MGEQNTITFSDKSFPCHDTNKLFSNFRNSLYALQAMLQLFGTPQQKLAIVESIQFLRYGWSKLTILNSKSNSMVNVLSIDNCPTTTFAFYNFLDVNSDSTKE